MPLSFLIPFSSFSPSYVVLAEKTCCFALAMFVASFHVYHAYIMARFRGFVHGNQGRLRVFEGGGGRHGMDGAGETNHGINS
jgi:hypothetical protein